MNDVYRPNKSKASGEPRLPTSGSAVVKSRVGMKVRFGSVEISVEDLSKSVVTVEVLKPSGKWQKSDKSDFDKTNGVKDNE
jgi:hypothetical protein